MDSLIWTLLFFFCGLAIGLAGSDGPKYIMGWRQRQDQEEHTRRRFGYKPRKYRFLRWQ